MTVAENWPLPGDRRVTETPPATGRTRPPRNGRSCGGCGWRPSAGSSGQTHFRLSRITFRLRSLVLWHDAHGTSEPLTPAAQSRKGSPEAYRVRPLRLPAHRPGNTGRRTPVTARDLPGMGGIMTEATAKRLLQPADAADRAALACLLRLRSPGRDGATRGTVEGRTVGEPSDQADEAVSGR